jgi:hypothetical protein
MHTKNEKIQRLKWVIIFLHVQLNTKILFTKGANDENFMLKPLSPLSLKFTHFSITESFPLSAFSITKVSLNLLNSSKAGFAITVLKIEIIYSWLYFIAIFYYFCLIIFPTLFYDITRKSPLTCKVLNPWFMILHFTTVFRIE